MSYDLNFSPASEPNWPSSPSTPNRFEEKLGLKTPLRWNSSWTDDGNERESSQESITSSILSDRKAKHKAGFPAYSSSPIHSRLEDQQRHMKRLRDDKRNHKVAHNRGGLDKMELFVMNSELSQELQRLSLQAQEYALPPDLAESFEREQQRDLEDDALIHYMDQRDQLDQELESMLAELSLK